MEPFFSQVHILSFTDTSKVCPRIGLAQSTPACSVESLQMPSFTDSCPFCIHQKLRSSLSDEPQI